MMCSETRTLYHDGQLFIVCYVERKHEEICKYYDIIVNELDKVIIICR
jgi:hypothetical protein